MNTILVVDDDEDIVRLFRHYLTDNLARPYTILEAANGQEALAVMRSRRPDLVFLDLLMPLLDGMGLLRHMSQQAALCEVPVIVISGQDALLQSHTAASREWLRACLPQGASVDQLIRGVGALITAVQPLLSDSPG